MVGHGKAERGELLRSGSVRVWYDALFLKKYVFDSPTRGA